MRAICLESATALDADAMCALVDASGLPLDGLEDQFPQAFVVARSAGILVGCAALERYGPAGLIRSVAVAEAVRGRGAGAALVTNRLRAAEDAGLASVYLLTTTAAAYFERFGFVVSERAGAPPDMARSPEFAHACPASATCLKLTFSDRAGAAQQA